MRSHLARVALLLALLVMDSLHAASDVSINAGPTIGGNFSGGSPNVFTPTAVSAVADQSVVQASLNAGDSVTINTASGAGASGDLTVDTPVSKTAGGAATLTLNGVRDLSINASLSATADALSLSLNAGRSISSSVPISSDGGDIAIHAVQTFSLGSSLDAGAGQVLLQAGSLESSTYQAVSASNVQVSAGAACRLLGAINGSLSVAGTLSAGPAVGSLQVNGNLTLQATATTVVDLGNSYDTIAATGDVTVAGSIQLNFLDGFENTIVNGYNFTILSGASISGTFTGQPNNSRIILPNELGSVKITYNATNVTLSDWQPYIRELTWDPGTSDTGTEVLTNTNTRAGRHYFHINAQATDIGAWKTRLTVASGEADLYLLNGAIPQVYSYNYISERIGSDGIMLPDTAYSPGQDWYIMVYASAGAQWSIFTGRAWVQDLGTLGWTDSNANGVYDIGEPVTASGSGTVTVPVEGIRFFKTVVPTGTPAWSLWLNGDTREVAVRKNFVPFPTGNYDRKQAGQMLVVPSYLTGVTTTYFVSFAGDPGDTVNLDSRIQQVEDMPFNNTFGNVSVPTSPYRVYRVQVPIQQIAWDVAVTPVAGDANVCVRRDNPPSEFDNDAFSEVSGSATDSITLVPDFLTDATWFITVYGNSPYTFTLRNGPPAISPLQFTDTVVNDQTARAGWRFYALTDINSQLGALGWELQLANQVPGTEIAIRRNAVPSRWQFRAYSGNTSYGGSGSRVDYSGTGGFLQRPGHQADIWYVGIYMPSQALGAFTLSCYPITPTAMSYDAGGQTLAGVEPGRWKYARVDVPSGVLGWDLRLTGVSGSIPGMVVRRDQLPGDLSTTYGWPGSPYAYYPPGGTSWPSGNQWAAGLGSAADWTNWYYDVGPPSNIPASPRVLMAAGRPLEAGTYYVGVYNNGGTTSNYTIDSRGIGAAGSGLTYEVQATLAFNGGSALANNVAPREAKYFKVTVPANTPSWEVTLDPSAGEMGLVVRRGAVPDFSASLQGDADSESPPGTPYGDVEVKMQKAGPERYVMLPYYGQNYIPAGDYYLAVFGEGDSPGGNVIGTGTSSGTLTSRGPLPVTNLGSATSTGLVQPVSLVGGQIQAFTFTVPANTNSLEVRMDSPTGAPAMRVYPGTHIPTPADFYGVDGGDSAYSVNPIFTQASPATGTWTVVMQAARDNTGAYPDATATMVFTALSADSLTYDGGTQAIVDQPAGTWRYFQVTVPSGVLGWDLRLRDVSGTIPGMVVKRDQLPNDLSTTYGWPGSPYAYYPPGGTSWPSGNQWAASLGSASDWTNWYYDVGPPSNIPAPPRLLMATGRPLEAGTYYIGVYNNGGTPSSYTIDSRGIGATGSGLTYEVQSTLAFNGGMATASNVAPREAKYFKVTIPANTPSWELTLDPSAGEMGVAVRRGAVPDFSASPYGEANLESPPGTPWGDVEVKMQKAGSERYVMLPSSGQDYIPAGDYYLAVFGEGMSPDANVIGTGASSGTLTSRGPLTVTNLGTATSTGLVQPVSLVSGQIRAFTFTVPAGTNSLEVRMDSPTGAPAMRVYPGTHVPTPYDNYGTDGGDGAFGVTPIFTQASPATGTWTVVIQAAHDNTGAYPDATATMVFTALSPVPLTFDGGTQAMVDHPAGAWRYFQVTVPNGVLGWDLRLRDVSGSLPGMVVKRDQLPNDLGTTYGWPGSPSAYYPPGGTSWPSGNQWAAGAGSAADWTNWYYDVGAPSYTPTPPRLLMATGRPLEAGTYYIGVYNNGGTPSSYTIDSRGIGATGSGLTYEVQSTLAFNGGATPVSNVAPREAKYFKVTIPANTPSWEVTLDPSAGEMGFALRRGAVPDFSAVYYGEADAESPPGVPYGDVEVKMQKAGPDRYVMLPYGGQNYIPAGDYYLAVFGEGVSPGGSVIGSGTSSGTLTNRGSLTVTALATATDAGLVQPVSLAGGQIQAFTFTVPANTNSLEVRLDSPTGFPLLSLGQGSQFPVPPVTGNDNYYGFDGGNGGFSDPHILTVVNPTPGTWTVLVRAGGLNFPDATANLVVRRKQNIPLNFDSSLNVNGGTDTDTRQAIDGEYNIYQVATPTIVNGQPVVGWIIKTDVFQGAVSLQVYKDFNNPNSGINVNAAFAVVVPPYLTLGDTWYVRVRAAGLTNYKITSRPVTLERPVWQMPTSHNLTFGDSGNDSSGNPLPGDRGVDLAQGEWHFYAIDVSDGNVGLLRTELQAISGNPDLYIREDGVPTTSHLSAGNIGNQLFQHSLTDTVTEYGNWVPLDGKTQKQLAPGRWFLGVKAAGNSNVRYRLIVSTGQVTDLALDGGSVINQILAGNDWRYYRFTVPADAPNNWALAFSQQVGDVVMWLRDTVPPGQGYYNNNSPSSIESWASDVKNQGPYNYSGQDAAGIYTFNTPPLRPGHTYFAGFRSNNSATFSVSSALNGGTIGIAPSIDFYTGTVTTSVPANSSLLYQIPVPPEATRFKYSAAHSSSVQIRLEQGTLPGTSGSQHYASNGADTSLNQTLATVSTWPPVGDPATYAPWPWQPSQTYYVRFVNSSASPEPITFTMNGQSALTEDEDADGLPDAWERRYFGSIYAYNGASDPDNDGNSNAVEFADGTNPGDGGSAKYTLTVQARNGVAGALPLQTKYDKGTVVTLTNTPSVGYTFLNWSGGPFRGDDFAVRATGTVTVPTSGTWTFGANSDDGVRITVNSTVVLTDDGPHSSRDALGQIALAAGDYTIEVIYYERGGDENLEVFAAPGAKTSFDGSFHLVGDTVNGGLAVSTLSGSFSVPGFTVRQVESLTVPMYNLAYADNLLAGVYAKGQDVTVVRPVLNFLTYATGEGRFPGNADFPLNAVMGNNPATIVMNGNYTITALNSLPLATVLNTPNWLWTSGGNAPWLGENLATAPDGVNAATSGPIGDGQNSFLQTKVAGPGTLSFFWKVSSQPGDYLGFQIDGGTYLNLSGEVDWEQRTFGIPAGVHILTWYYTKDASSSSGSDRAWLDQVSFTSPALAAWTAGFGLTGSDALADADPDKDGRTNLMEFAYNLDPTQPGGGTLSPGTGTSGLPSIRTIQGGSSSHLVVEFVRRKAGGVLYTVQFSDTPAGGGWETATSPEVVTSIDADWERVVVEDTVTTGGTATRYARVLLTGP